MTEELEALLAHLELSPELKPEVLKHLLGDHYVESLLKANQDLEDLLLDLSLTNIKTRDKHADLLGRTRKIVQRSRNLIEVTLRKFSTKATREEEKEIMARWSKF
jgi:hypothetical protein